MDGAKAFFSKLVGLDDGSKGQQGFHAGGGSGGVGGGVEGKGRFGNGIGNTAIGIDADIGGGSGYMGTWGEDRMTNVAISVRIFQLVCAFSLLIVVITLATFQTKWVGKLSGLTALLLIVTILTFVLVAFLISVSFFPHSWHITQDKIIRVLEQPRLGLAMNGVGLGVWLIIAMTQTISSYTMPGCKDPSKDPSVNTSKGKKDDFVAALPGFCTTKKAGAAFAWFIFVTCAATMLLFLRMWKLSRRNGPRIPPFVHPADEGAFEQLGDDMGHDEDENVYAHDQGGGVPIANRYGEGGDGRYGYGGYEDTRMQNAYGGGAGYDVDAARYGGRHDPFADQQQPPRQSYDYEAYGAASTTNVAQDPYAAIQQQLRNERAPQLPPLYRG